MSAELRRVLAGQGRAEMRTPRVIVRKLTVHTDCRHHLARPATARRGALPGLQAVEDPLPLLFVLLARHEPLIPE